MNEFHVLICLIIAYVFYRVYKAEKRNKELELALKLQDDSIAEYKALLHVREAENDLNRQLSNLFSYDGTSKGQVKKGEKVNED